MSLSNECRDVNATKLLMLQYTRHQKRTSVYDIIFNRCLDKVTRCAKQGSVCCSFNVPPFIVGLPMYNRSECRVYVTDLLKLRGFVIHEDTEYAFTISWSVEDCRMRSHGSQISNTHHREDVEFLPFHPSPRLKGFIDEYLYVN